MMALITLLPAGKKIKIAPHQTIAAALRQAGYDFGSTCTHDAHCTSCRIALIDGQAQIDYGEFQQELQPLLQVENLVVACLATVKGNIILEAPLLLRPTKTAVRKRVRTAEEPSANPRSNPCSIIDASVSSNLNDAAASSFPASSSFPSPPSPSSQPAWYRFWGKDAGIRRTRGGGRRARFFQYTPAPELATDISAPRPHQARPKKGFPLARRAKHRSMKTN